MASLGTAANYLINKTKSAQYKYHKINNIIAENNNDC